MKVRISKPRYCVLIPSKGRPDQLMKTLEKQPFLNRPSTFIRIHTLERKTYKSVQDRFRRIIWLESVIHFTDNNGCVAREELRTAATSVGFERYVPTDDNARYTEESLENLIRASYVYPKQPCIVSGFHGTAPHFDSSKIKKAREYDGFHFYEKWGAIFWAIPHHVYSRMSYPHDGGRMDDRFVSLAALRLGVFDWVVCMEAPFTKPTGTKGGYSASGRTSMMGQSVVALARDYPEYMEKITISFPWKKILEKAKTKGAS
jgi:hypothetical protein